MFLPPTIFRLAPPPDPAVEGAPVPAELAFVVVPVVDVPRLATRGAPDFPPQPASDTARRMSGRARSVRSIAVQGYRRRGYDQGTRAVIPL
jgi:hypothetical protein